MIELVTLEEVKAHLKVDHDLDDSDLRSKIRSASAFLLDWIQGSRSLVVDNNGVLIDGEPLSRVREATLRLVGFLYRNPDGSEKEDLQKGDPPFEVSFLIHSLRRPTII